MNTTIEKKSRTSTKKLLEKLHVFTKAQLSAFIGGVVDYLIMIFFTEIFQLHYTISIVIGGVIGAIVNFSLNKTWSFYSKDIPFKNSILKQVMKFVLVVLNSILLKSSGTYFITTFLGFDYRISRIATDLFVSIVFNYTLQKYWVFRKTNYRKPDYSTFSNFE
jgi:putative flippase GtrA